MPFSNAARILSGSFSFRGLSRNDATRRASPRTSRSRCTLRRSSSPEADRPGVSAPGWEDHPDLHGIRHPIRVLDVEPTLGETGPAVAALVREELCPTY